MSSVVQISDRKDPTWKYGMSSDVKGQVCGNVSKLVIIRGTNILKHHLAQILQHNVKASKRL